MRLFQNYLFFVFLRDPKLVRICFLSFSLCCFACNSAHDEQTDYPDSGTNIEFDKTKWATKVGKDYPYRDAMLEDVITDESWRSLNREGILDSLGEPDRTNDNHLYYMIKQKRLGFWALHSKFLVIKLRNNNDSIEWMKVHE